MATVKEAWGPLNATYDDATNESLALECAGNDIFTINGDDDTIEFNATINFNNSVTFKDLTIINEEGSTTTALRVATDSVSDAFEVLSATDIVEVNTTFNVQGATVFNEDGADVDFRIESDTVTNAFVVDAGTDTVQVNTTLSVDGAAVFNESGADVDFRVETDAEANAFVVDAGLERVVLAVALRLVSMDDTARDALTPGAGDLIFSTTSNSLEFYNGSAWDEVATV